MYNIIIKLIFTGKNIMTIGDQIKHLRTAHHLTQQEFATKIYISYQSVSNWENHRGYPSTEIMLLIIDTFDLPLNYFIAKDIDATTDHEETLILSSFLKCMATSRDEAPNLKTIQQLSGVSAERVQHHFPSYDDLVYTLINKVDQDIKIRVEKRLSDHEGVLSIFINDMAPLLYHKKETLHILYTRPYIKGVWMHFINTKYQSLLIKYNPDIKKNDLDTAYLIEILTAFISIWLSQPEIEPLEQFQARITYLVNHNIASWHA